MKKTVKSLDLLPFVISFWECYHSIFEFVFPTANSMEMFRKSNQYHTLNICKPKQICIMECMSPS